MKLYLVEYTVDSVVKNMIVRAKDHNAAETQVKVSVIVNIHDDNFLGGVKMTLNKGIAAGIILISIFYIILSYTLFIFADKDEYRDVKDIISVVGVVIGTMTFLMLFVGQ